MLHKSYFWVLILGALILGLTIGHNLPDARFYTDPLGEIFIRFIKMLVVPILALSIITATTTLIGKGSFKKMGALIFCFYLSSTFVAASIAVVMGTLFLTNIPIKIPQTIPTGETVHKAQEFSWSGFIPENPFAALAEGHIVQILFFSAVLGVGIASLAKPRQENISSLLDSLLQGLIFVLSKVMILAPLAAFAMAINVSATVGWQLFFDLGKLLAIFVATVVIHFLFFHAITLKLFTNIPIGKFLHAAKDPQLVAMATTSSLATLSTTMEACEETLKIDRSITSATLPLGATINMDGTAMFDVLTAIFLASLFKIDLNLPSYFAIIITATIGSVGHAAIPGPSMLAAAVLQAGGIPLNGLPLIYGIDRLVDMIRTSVNITGDMVCAVFVAKISDSKPKK